jgi:hypothetical protein
MTEPTLAEREKAIEEVKPCAKMEDRAWLVAVVLLLVGIISDAVNIKLGLAAGSWLLLGIAALVAAVFFRLGRAIYWNMNPPK